MDDYNKIIESLAIRFIKSRNIGILQSVSVDSYYDVENKIFLLERGSMSWGEDNSLQPGEILFVPGGKATNMVFGNDSAEHLTIDDFITKKDRYLKRTDRVDKSTEHSYTVVSFEAKVFNTVNFFGSLDIPPFKIDRKRIGKLIASIQVESRSGKPGNARVVNLLTDQLVVEIIRFVIDQNEFKEKLLNNVTYFKDPRLIDIFTYIKENIGGDLSNKTLAEVANVSEDYVGQYFKMMTGINPQDYIEYQRMEMAVQLLRTSKKSIRDIGTDIGYRDTAYFCRRFKMMFGIPAGKMRRRESLMNV